MIVRGRVLPMALGIYGVLVAGGVLIGMMSGHLSLDAHGFGLIDLEPGDLVGYRRHLSHARSGVRRSVNVDDGRLKANSA